MRFKKATIFITALALIGCNQSSPTPSEAKITSIKANLTKLNYVVGERLDYLSLNASVTKDNNITETYDFSEFDSNGLVTKLEDENNKEIAVNSEFEVAGKYFLTVSLRESSDIKDVLSIDVKEKEIIKAKVVSIKINYDKNTYFEFETIDLSKLSITLLYDDNSEENVSYADLSSRGYDINLLDLDNNQIDLSKPLELGKYHLVVYSISSELKDEIEINVIEEDYSLIGNEKLSLLKDELSFENNEYISSKNRSIKIFDDYFNKGIFQAKVSVNESGFDNYLFFAYDQVSESYYSFGVNMKNKLQITYFNGEKLSLIKSFDGQVEDNPTLQICFDANTGSTDFYVNNSFIYSYYIAASGDLKYGLYAGAKGCKFSNVMINEDSSLFDNDFNNYQTANGNYTNDNGTFTVKSAQSLNYHKTKTFTRGEIEVTYNGKNANSTAGIVFCIDNNGKTSFYRDKEVSYYYLCVTIGGTIGLYRVKDQQAILLKNLNTKNYYLENDHVMKVLRDNDNTIHAFLDGNYCFSYVEKHPLKGDKFGLSSTSSNFVFKSISVKNTFSEIDSEISDYDVTSGEFYKNKDLIVAKSLNAMIVKKTPGTMNGTINAEISLGQNYGTGLVFRLTKPETNNFYEKENGLSYYWLDIKSNNRIIFARIDNGVISWSNEKYMPYFMSNAAKVKIVLNNNEIYAYYTNVLVFHYVDNNPLTGLYYGLRSDSKGATIKGDISFSSSTEIETNRYLIFGHSYTQLWHHYKDDFSELGEDINNIGIGGSQTKNWSDQYTDEVICYNPEWGIYWNGINDINSDISTENIINNYKKCLNTIKEHLPNFKCVVISIARCAHEKTLARFDKISEANNLIKEYCNQNDWLVYVEVERVYCDESGNPIESYFLDKLHPTTEGYRLVSPLVVEAIKNYQ